MKLNRTGIAIIVLIISILGSFSSGFCFGQEYQQDENSRVAQGWKSYAGYVIEEATIQCDAWRDRAESFEAALAVANDIIKGKLTLGIEGKEVEHN